MFKKIIRKAINMLNAYEMLPPYDYVQNVVSRNLSDYLRKKGEISNICIVGGYLGKEVPLLLNKYPNVKVTIFECSQRYSDKLEGKFRKNSNVKIIKKAVSNEKLDNVDFYETTLRGSGSILKLGDLAKSSYGAKQAEAFTVESTTLDIELGNEVLDCLWIDVQGAELLVLKGAQKILERTHSVFIEVSILPDLYEGAVIMKNLTTFLDSYGFELTLLGLDKKNLTGNAFYTRQGGLAQNL